MAYLEATLSNRTVPVRRLEKAEGDNGEREEDSAVNDKREPWNCVFIKSEPPEYEPANENDFRTEDNVKSEPEDSILPDRPNIVAVSKNIVSSKESDVILNSGEKRSGYRGTTYSQSSPSVFGRRKVHWCDQCQREFKTAQSLRYHIGTHTGNKLFHCTICNKGFQRLYDMNDHMRIHSDVKPFECAVCKKGFLRPRDLKFHMAVHSDEKPHECPVCKKRFLRTHDLKEHVGTHSDDKPHKCNICNKGFQRADRLRSHINTHAETKPYICPVCAKGLSRSFDLKVHMRTHSDVKPFECQVCKQGFLRRCDLTSHMHIHENKKPFVCDVCNKGFVRMSYLRVHKRIHLDEKPFECEICCKRFIRTHDLNIHMRWHTGEKPFECDICKKRFRNHHAMKLHIIAHMEGGRPYKCPICNRGFQRADFVNIHLKTHRRKGEMGDNDDVMLFGTSRKLGKDAIVRLQNTIDVDSECVEVENNSGHTLINQELVSMLKTELGTCNDPLEDKNQEQMLRDETLDEEEIGRRNDTRICIGSSRTAKVNVQLDARHPELILVKSEPIGALEYSDLEAVNHGSTVQQFESINIKQEPIEAD